MFTLFLSEMGWDIVLNGLPCASPFILSFAPKRKRKLEIIQLFIVLNRWRQSINKRSENRCCESATCNLLWAEQGEEDTLSYLLVTKTMSGGG